MPTLLDILKAAKIAASTPTQSKSLVTPLYENSCFDCEISSDQQVTKDQLNIISSYPKLGIFSYTDKPTFDLPCIENQRKHSSDTIFTHFGVELEVECLEGLNYHREHLIGATARALNAFDKNFAIFKHDGSLKNRGSGGFEICTRPSTLDTHKKTFGNFFENIPVGLGTSTRCGMHVHVSRKPLTKLQISKILLFIHHPCNRKLIQNIAGRLHNHYCDYTQKIDKPSYVLPRYKENHSHYAALNIGGAETVEFRIFASTLNKNIFCKNLEFCHAIIRFFSVGSISMDVLRKNGANSDFLEFVKSSRRLYPHLFSFLAFKKLISPIQIRKETHIIPIF